MRILLAKSRINRTSSSKSVLFQSRNVRTAIAYQSGQSRSCRWRVLIRPDGYVAAAVACAQTRPVGLTARCRRRLICRPTTDAIQPSEIGAEHIRDAVGIPLDLRVPARSFRESALSPGAVIVADNVDYCPEYLEFIEASGDYTSMPFTDDVELAIRDRSYADRRQALPTPAAVHEGGRQS